MTEREWLDSTHPSDMIRHLSRGLDGAGVGYSERKLKLFACACSRFWKIRNIELSPSCRPAHHLNTLVVAEQIIDGVYHPIVHNPCSHFQVLTGDVSDAVDAVVDDIGNEFDGRVQLLECCAVLRDVIGNPFRHVPTDDRWFDRAWLTSTVVSIATAAYQERQTKACPACAGVGCMHCSGTGNIMSGELDSDTLLILADALEDVGCTDDDVLKHLRGHERVIKDVHVTIAKTSGNPFHEPASNAPIGWGIIKCGMCPGRPVRIEKRLRDAKAYAEREFGVETWSKSWNRNGSCHGVGRPEEVWVDLRGPHVRGCWVIDLILGKQ